jgi:hypothetical protein
MPTVVCDPDWVNCASEPLFAEHPWHTLAAIAIITVLFFVLRKVFTS